MKRRCSTPLTVTGSVERSKMQYFASRRYVHFELGLLVLCIVTICCVFVFEVLLYLTEMQHSAQLESLYHL